MTTATSTLGALLTGIDDARVRGDAALPITEVRDDSRRCGPGDLFVAVPGVAVDGRAFVADAVARGAIAIVVEQTGEQIGVDVTGAATVVTVPSARHALGVIAANRYRAAAALGLLAVTGTNGKTTTSYIVEQMLRAAGHAAGLFGTVSYRAVGLPGRPAPLTTPGALMLHEILAEMRAVGTTDVVLEATSHALEQGRLDGCRFRVAALTNVTQDHLDYHGTMARYFDAKALLFTRLIDQRAGVAVTFADDEHGREMAARAQAPARLTIARGPGIAADVVVERHTLAADGTRATLATPAGRIELASPLVGEFNLSNLALAVGMAIAHGLPAEAIAAGAAAVAVPGRLERVANERGVLCVVDYAHTPDALARAIATMRPLVAPGGRLLVVFGCGGDRDRGKRPLMGEIAARGADLTFVTSDNPRTEEADAIVEMILDGVRKTAIRELSAEALGGEALRGAARGYHVAADRRTAIRRAGAAAAPGDVLLIAGKGHEDYQILGTTKIHFDDREEAAAALAPAGVAA